jgi:hypothetical protein
MAARPIALSDSEKAEALADRPDTQYQPATDPSVPAVIKIVDVALKSHFMTPASEPKLTNPYEFHEDIRGLKVSKAPVPNGIPNRALEIYHGERYLSLSRFSMRSSSPITFLQCGSTLE